MGHLDSGEVEQGQCGSHTCAPLYPNSLRGLSSLLSCVFRCLRVSQRFVKLLTTKGRERGRSGRRRRNSSRDGFPCSSSSRDPILTFLCFHFVLFCFSRFHSPAALFLRLSPLVFLSPRVFQTLFICFLRVQ